MLCIAQIVLESVSANHGLRQTGPSLAADMQAVAPILRFCKLLPRPSMFLFLWLRQLQPYSHAYFPRCLRLSVGRQPLLLSWPLRHRVELHLVAGAWQTPSADHPWLFAADGSAHTHGRSIALPVW